MNSLYGNFRQRKFTDIFSTATQFVNNYKASGLYASNNKISDTSATTLFYLLYARYGNSVIASSDENQFAYKVWALIYQFGPTWEKNISIQNDLRSLNDTDLLTGSKMIYNHAYNPSSEPGTTSVTELTYINEQNTNGSKKSKMDAYAILTALLEKDVTEEFLSKFKKLFLVVVEPERPLWYITNLTEEEQEEEE